MEQGWFYAEGEGSVGPVSADALAAALRRLPEPGNTPVWRAGFEDWRAARDVPELANRLLGRVPEAVTLDPQLDRWSASDPQSDSWEDGLPQATQRRRWPYVAAIAAVTVIVAGGLLYASRIAPTTTEPESRVVLPAASAPEQAKREAVRKDPAAVLAQLTETAAQAAAATEALAQKLWAEIEPPNMPPPDYLVASRSDLESHMGVLRTAEANVTDAYNRYTVLQKAERELIEEAARSAELDENVRAEFLTQVKDRQNETLELITSMLKARLELYRAMQRMEAIPIEQFGKFKRGADGIRFSSKAVSDRFAAAAAEVTEANKRLDRAEDRILQQARPSAPPPQPSWLDMVKK